MNYTFLIFVALACTGLFVFHEVTRPVNPWKQFGVTAAWHPYGGATTLEEPVYETEFEGARITGTACPGSQRNYVLRSEDTEGDGIPEVILKTGKSEVILAFRPAADGKPPRFETLSDACPP
jgi:hypothetical protein